MFGDNGHCTQQPHRVIDNSTRDTDKRIIMASTFCILTYEESFFADEAEVSDFDMDVTIRG